MLHADGIERRAARAKSCSACSTASRRRDHPLTPSASGALRVPHSRYNELPERGAGVVRLRILTRSADAGVDVFARQDGSFLFPPGPSGIRRGYAVARIPPRRRRFLGGERERYPALPHGYFNDEATAHAAAFRERALAGRRADLIAEFPKSVLEAGLQSPWRPAALGIYEKWIDFLTARKAERRSLTRAVAPRPGAIGRSGSAGGRQCAALSPACAAEFTLCSGLPPFNTRFSGVNDMSNPIVFAAPADVELLPAPIPPHWIVEGTPQARSKRLAAGAPTAPRP